MVDLPCGDNFAETQVLTLLTERILLGEIIICDLYNK